MGFIDLQWEPSQLSALNKFLDFHFHICHHKTGKVVPRSKGPWKEDGEDGEDIVNKTPVLHPCYIHTLCHVTS